MVKLLSSLKKLEAENCIILTYNLDLAFFEAGLFEPLYSYGCRNTLVVCDPDQYQIALGDTPLLRYAGQRYILFPGQTSPLGAFHPKLIMLTSKTEGHLYLLSGNLSRAGYTSNWEVLTEFEYRDRHPDEFSHSAFRWVFDTARKIIRVSDPGGLAQERLDRLWGTTPWLRKENQSPANERVWTLNNLEKPILSQIEEIFRATNGGKVRKAVVISPFFDREFKAFESFLSCFNPQSVDIFTQELSNIDSKALKRVIKKHPTKFTLNQIASSRRLHAKVILLKTDDEVWVSSGSANFSAPALMKPASLGNTELTVLRYEPEITYFDDCVRELTGNAIPLDLDDVPQPEINTFTSHPKQKLKLQSACLQGLNLELQLSNLLALKSTIVITLRGEISFTKEYSIQQRSENGSLTIKLSKELAGQMDSPTLVSVSLAGSVDSDLISNYVLIHNLAALEKFGRPPNTASRPKIPPGLVPDNENDYAWLLDMIHDLLITNRDQLKRHNPRLLIRKRVESQEEQIEAEYRSEDHLVDAPVRAPQGNQESNDLYPDYEKRWTYQEILNAVLAATYSSTTEETARNSRIGAGETSNATKKDIPVAPLTNNSQEQRARLRNRISYGFNRLVENFQIGLSDTDYLDAVPPSYLLELWLIITRYLHVVWRNGLLEKEEYLDLSLIIFFDFWGKPGEPGAWQIIKNRFPATDLQQELHRLLVPLNAWLHATDLWNILESDKDEIRFDLAGWMRMFIDHVFSLDQLTSLESDYEMAWRNYFPGSLLPGLDDFIKTLEKRSQEYSDLSLGDEIQERTGFSPTIEYGKIANLSQAPKLFLRMPLTDAVLDQCFSVFQLFLTRPREKSFAWARFENTDPVESENDIRSITVFFRSDTKTLLFVAERLQHQVYKPEYDLENISIEKLRKTRNLADLTDLYK